jgi:hypothetical protein
VTGSKPSPYLANLIEEETFALEGLAEILTQTGRAAHAQVLAECARKIATVAQQVRRSAPPGREPQPNVD